MLLSRRARSAFTLIELLVVIAIIAILVGLLVPAVQKVRAAAARAQCSNNLKNIGLAFHLYQDNKRSLPAGWVTSNTVFPSPGWSWSLLILPYVEQQSLYSAVNPDVVTPGGPVAASGVILTPVPIYACPADSQATTNPSFGNYGKMNYVVNRFVTGPDSSSRPAPMSIQGIRDGASNTLLVGERDMVINVAASSLIRHNQSSCSFEGRVGRGINPQPAAGAVWTTGNDQRLAFSSQHTGGCNFVFADGSVHFLSDSIDADPNDNWANFPTPNSTAFTLQRLQMPNDGQPVSVPDL